MRLAVPESEFQGQVMTWARLRGWLYYHTHRSDRSVAGFPDLTLVRGPRLEFLELKGIDARGRPGKGSPEQEAWIEALGQVTDVGAAFAWPEDLDALCKKLR